LQTEVSESQSTHQQSDVAVDLKGSVFTLPILLLRSTNIDAISRELEHRLAKALRFFANAPVVIDLSIIAQNDELIDFHTLLKLLSRQQLIPVGVRNGSSQLNSFAIGAGLAILKGGAIQDVAQEIEKVVDQPESDKNTNATSQVTQTIIPKAKIITQPVRSGQQIYAAGGDLIIMAPVNHGAEIIADGNIHVYSVMRGRALAGVRGDENARIFCQSIEAELIAIAGNFRVFEESMPKEIEGKPVQAYLQGERLIIAPLVS